MKLNLGCGNSKLPGYKNIDISKEADADEYYDITKGLCEDSDSVEEINAGCVLEQIGDNWQFIRVLNDCWRVLKKDGILKGYVPSIQPEVLFVDPMDKRFFQETTFDYFDGDKHCWREFGKNYGFKPWKDVKIDTNDNGIIHFEMKPAK